MQYILQKFPNFTLNSSTSKGKVHFIQELIEKGELNLFKVPRDNNVVYMFTNIMNVKKTKVCVVLIGIIVD